MPENIGNYLMERRLNKLMKNTITLLNVMKN